MKAFDIKDSIVRPFAKLQFSEAGLNTSSYGLVQDYSSRNLPCGGINFGNLNTIMRSADFEVKKGVMAVKSVLSVIDGCVDAGFAIAGAIADCMDKVSELMDKVQEFDLSDKLDKINLKLQDLGVGIAKAAAATIKGLVDGVGKAITAIGTACKAALNLFKSGVNIPGEDPISEIAGMLECSAANVLDMLSAGISALTGGSSSFGFTNPLKGVMSVIGGTIGAATAAVGAATSAVNGVIGTVNGAVNGVQGAVGGVINQINGTVNGLTSAIPGPVKGILAGVNPKAAQFLNQNGIGSFLNTALNDKMYGVFGTKNVVACVAAQKLNRFGNYDPYISSSMNIGGLTPANQILAAVQYGTRITTSNNDSCVCCPTERYADQAKYLNMASSFYDRRENYSQAYSSTSAYGAATYFDSGVSSQTRASYGYTGESNLLNENLATSLESYRVYDKLSGNLKEVSTDFTKLPAFAAECKSSMDYLKGITESNLQSNLCISEDLLTKSAELEQSSLMSGFPLAGVSEAQELTFPIDASNFPDPYPRSSAEPISARVSQIFDQPTQPYPGDSSA
jgi:hypothetical protein